MNKNGPDGFIVRHIAVEESEDLNALVVGLSDMPDGSDNVLMLQKGLEFDEQDRALEMDTYSISTASGATFYGGIASCILQDDLLTLTLTPEAADTLGATQTCEFQLEIDPDSVARLREGLRQILADESPMSPEYST